MSEFDTLFEVMTMPLKRAFVFLFSLQVLNGVSLGALLLIGVFFAVLIEIIVHSRAHIAGGYEKGESEGQSARSNHNTGSYGYGNRNSPSMNRQINEAWNAGNPDFKVPLDYDPYS